MDGVTGITETPAAEAPAPAAQPAAGAAPAPAPADPYADFAALIPQGVKPADFIRETLSVRRQIDNHPGGLDAIIQAKALEVAPALAEQLLRSPEGRALAAKIAGVAARQDQGEELGPEEQKLLELTDRLERSERATKAAQDQGSANSVALLRAEIHNGMEREFGAAMREQPEMEEFGDEIRERIALEASANPDVLEPGFVKRRALELHGRFSAMAQKAAPKFATRGRAAGSSGGAATPAKDPTTLTREEASDLMAEIMRSGS